MRAFFGFRWMTAGVLVAGLVVACGEDDAHDGGDDDAGEGGSGDESGRGGKSGASGRGGTTSGAAGTAGRNAGSGGDAGNDNSAGDNTGGTSPVAGFAGEGGEAGSSTGGHAGEGEGGGDSGGTDGSGGSAAGGSSGNGGSDTSAGGNAGSGGSAGSSGNAGAGGSSTAGTGGTTAGSAGTSSGGTGGAATETVVLTNLEDSYVDWCFPTANYGSAPELRVGYEPCQQEMFIKPITLGDIGPGATIVSATLSVVCTSRPIHDVDVSWLFTSWNESTVNWDNRPTGVGFETLEIEQTGTLRIDVTDTVQDWIDGDVVNGFGFAMFFGGSGAFAASEGGPANEPKITIEYVP